METATIDPTSVPTDMPPPLALSLKVKYPDIYNRYRKLKGPIKATKPLKTRRAAANRSQLAASSPLQLGDSVKPEVISGVQQGAAQHFDENGVGLEIDPQMTDELAILASQGHADLAQALSRLPRQRQYVEHDQLDDAMLTMTEGDPEGVKEEKSETAWK